VQSRADQGEEEYYYTSKEETEIGTHNLHTIRTKKEAKMDQKAAEEFEDQFCNPGPSSSQGVRRALLDGNVKEPADQTTAEKQKEINRLQKELKKLSAVVTQLQGQGFSTVAKIREMVAEKPFLKSLLETLERDCDLFNKARDGIVAGVHAAKDDPTEENIEDLKKILVSGQAHVDGFKASSFQDARGLTGGKEK